MTIPCSCPLAGYCSRHQSLKTPHLHSRCQTNDKLREFWDQKIAAVPVPIRRRRKLGNLIARWLAIFGITKRRMNYVSRVLTGKPCGCRKRQRALNQITL